MDSIISSFGPMVRLMAPPQGEGGGNPIMTFLPLIAIVAIFYFLILRPQKKRQQETQKMLSAIRKGDKVVTIGGMHGIVTSVRESTVVIKVDENVKLEFNRSAISSVSSNPKEDNAKDDKEESSEETSGEAK